MSNFPKHIALIMDGNNRWSKKNKKSLYDSYLKGALKLFEISDYLISKKKIHTVSAFALSTNNLKRSKGKLEIINKVITNTVEKIIANNSYGFKIRIVGDINVFSETLLEKIKLLEKRNLNSNKTLNIFINYGGQEEIINLINYFRNSKTLVTKEIVYSQYFKNLYSSPDLLLRTGGFQRLSNFILYQISFSELFFIKKLWPDINKKDLDKIINTYKVIERKFGI